MNLRCTVGAIATSVALPLVSSLPAGAAAAQPDPIADPDLRSDQNASSRPVTVSVGETVTYTSGGYTITTSVVRDTATETALAEVKSVKCWRGKSTLEATEVGLPQHTWRHVVVWCFSGDHTYRGGMKSNRGINIDTAGAWKFQGNIDSYHERHSKHYRVRKQAEYEGCFPWPTGCQYHYPTHSGNYKKGKVKDLVWEPK
jgi:hypothetical protein